MKSNNWSIGRDYRRTFIESLSNIRVIKSIKNETVSRLDNRNKSLKSDKQLPYKKGYSEESVDDF